MKIVAIAGGVGGARMADGLAQELAPDHLSVIVNVGDDFEHFGLKICPDLDTVCYTLAGLANPETGWGRAAESWEAMATINTLGGPGWFRLGDRDLGLHLERTRRLAEGQTLSAFTRDVCYAWEVGNAVLPVSDHPVPTMVGTSHGELPFQEYFVRLRCEPAVTGFHFYGVENASAATGVIEALDEADGIVFCPSNPWVSIDPILAVPGIREALMNAKNRGVRILAVSPIIGGGTVKGPAAKMYRELGIEPSAIAVARHYQDLLTDFVLDVADAHLISADTGAEQTLLEKVYFWSGDILMKDRLDRGRLAAEILKVFRNKNNQIGCGVYVQSLSAIRLQGGA